MAQTLMKCSFSLVLALILALVGTIATAPADAQSDPAARSPSLSELLEKAIFTEETLGDLDAAIDMYREILVYAVNELAGVRPFIRETAGETMGAILADEPPALPENEGPEALQRIVAHCLEKDSEQRFQSAGDLAFALRGLLGEESG